MAGSSEPWQGRSRACWAILLGALACLASAPTGAAAQEPGATPDVAARTPAAQAGSSAAATASLSRSGLRRELRRALRSVGGGKGAWVFDTGAARSPVLFAQNARKGRILASNQKLFTTAAALDRFGPEHRFRTAVYARGERNGENGRILEGSLVIRGDGDPAFASQSFARRHGLPLTRVGDLARAIRTAGIRRVTGMIRADDTIFDRRRGIPATGYRPSPWLSPLSGLSFNAGFAASGGYARDPELEAASALRRALIERNVSVDGGIARAALGPRFRSDAEPVASVTSPPLAALAAATNKRSHNFFAEMLIKRLGGGAKAKGTTQRGARRVQRFARRVGSRVRASDGSGLGRGNRASPRQVGRLLRAIADADYAEAFHASLAIAGRDGTLASRMRGTAAQDRCAAKTGTLTGVSTLSGYCEAGARRIAFSILMNGVDATAARRAQDHMVAAIARYR
jgi:serine-type D-Ala-D-Ala carboxypeptidase/endopeptidase (penicillin-binding protein 4)